MLFAIISSISCFIAAFMLFNQTLNNSFLSKLISFFFLFEGTWTLFNFIFHKIYPENQFMITVNYVCTAIFTGTLIFGLYKKSKSC